MEYTAPYLFTLLNSHDESDWIEAKAGSESSKAVLETVCAFSNEPGLGGGYLLLGIVEKAEPIEEWYEVQGVADLDKVQSDIATQCASVFNQPVRPEIKVEEVQGQKVLNIYIPELPDRQKPLYFRKQGLPGGAYRRIGPTDQRCTEEDLHVFYGTQESFDQTPVSGTSLAEVDEHALKRYRSLREKLNPAAEELTYDDSELMEALGCLSQDGTLTLAGLVLFGNAKALRRHYPMLRVDYIRVPGTTWIADPDDRFTTIDMRGHSCY